jgi:tryptophan-rich sensory protein
MDWFLFLTFLAACGAAAATGAMFKPGDWYFALSKPAWTPPGFVFPLVWTSLYILMAWSAARVAVLPGSGQALAFWGLQIAINTLWSPVFFGLHRLRSAMIIIAFLWLSVAATMVSFFMLDFWSGVMFVPYLIWVSIASMLNFRVMQMNAQAAT